MMGTDFDSFDGSPLGEFVESPLGERNETIDICVPKVLASATVYWGRQFDLRPYQGPHMACPFAFWRLIEVSHCYPYSYPWYGAGHVDESGRLTGLRDFFTPPRQYSYDGYIELQIGCLTPDGQHIIWPGECQAVTGVF